MEKAVRPRFRPDGFTHNYADGSLLVGILDTAKLIGGGRTRVYELMDNGELESVKQGRRRLITRASIEAYVKRLVEASRAGRRAAGLDMGRRARRLPTC